MTGLDRDQIWTTIDAQRAAVADLLDTLAAPEWRQPSLCAAWTVRDVAAHLTLQQLSLIDVLGILPQWRGSMDRTTEHIARRRAAALPTERLIAGIRATIGSRKRNFGVTCRETLIDILVHSQDLAIPLGRRLEMPPEAAAVAADRVLSMRWPPPPPARRTVAGFRLAATDIAWSAGEGPEVRGPMASLLLLCTGRTIVFPDLSGPGAATLAARFPVAQP